MTLEPLQQWSPILVIAALHRVTHPEWTIPACRAVWRLLKRSKPVIEEIAPIVERAVIAAPAAAIQPEPMEHTPMKLNLANLAGAMAKAAAAVNTTSANASQLYSLGAKLVSVVESAYKTSGAGTHKRAAVIAAVQAAAGELQTDYATLAPEFEPWLEAVIGAYNAAASVVNAPAAPAASTIIGDAEALYDKAAAVVSQVVPVALTTAQLIERSMPKPNTNGI